MIIKPSVGRIVWYYPEGSLPNSQPWAAIIACVHSDSRVNLCLVNPSGVTMPESDVLLVQGNDPAPSRGGYCKWMPFQISQASRAEQAETTVRAMNQASG